jgi:hypothetical protein
MIPCDREGARRSRRHSGAHRSPARCFQLQPWDWDFYAAQVRKAKFDLDVEAIKPLLRTQSRAAGRRLLRRARAVRHHVRGAARSAPVSHPDIRVLEVFDPYGTRAFGASAYSGGWFLCTAIRLGAPSGTDEICYSDRSAVNGSTLVARRAGTYAASVVTTENASDTPTKVPGSSGATPNRSPAR